MSNPLMHSAKKQAMAILTELIQDGEDRRAMVKDSDNFRTVRQDWLDKALPAIEEVKGLKVLPPDSFFAFNNPDITGTLSEYEDGIAGDLEAAEKTKKAFDSDITCLRGARRLP
jgi:hypothetical protein